MYLALSELIANGGNLERAKADAEAAVDALSSEAAKTVKALKKSLTLKKSASSITKPTPSHAEALGSGRCVAPDP